MSIAFVIVSLITLIGAIGALAFRQIVHSVLCLAITFTGVAMLYLQLGAQFLGFAQFLVYIGAVTILILFAILLTKNSGPTMSTSPFSSGIGSGLIVGGSVLACLCWAILRTPGLDPTPVADPNATVKAIGLALMSDYVIPLEVIALLLTAAMVGAIVIAMNESQLNETKGKPSAPAKGQA
jgi:NADH-quinone oxidoreductase subunit J